MRTSILTVLLAAAPLLGQDAPPAAGAFKVSFDPALQTTPFSGRIFITLGKKQGVEPRRGLGDWQAKNPMFVVDAKDVAPDGSVAVDGTAESFPKPLAEVEPGEYEAQAIARRNTQFPFPGFGPGDLVSEPVKVSVKPGDPGVVELKLSREVKEEPFTETSRIKEVSIVSTLLSKFHGREVSARAAVILPTNWKDVPGTRHPTVYFIGGFGSTHAFASALESRLPKSSGEVMVVVLDARGDFGHTYFVDSPNNGPRAQSLIEELIPAVEKRFHGATSPDLRWVTGIKCGGWAALWLMTNHPETFGNCWAFCPDPVDFRDFSRVNLYAENANLYKDDSGARRPFAHNGKEVITYFDELCRQEKLLDAGGQMKAFEAAFGPKGDDGKPRPLFNRETGAIDAETAKLWEKYDLRQLLEKNASTLGPKIRGNTHIYAGEFDNFYLDGAVRLLAASQRELQPPDDVDAHIVPGAGHGPPTAPFGALFQILRDRAAGSSNLPSIDKPQ